MELKQGSRLYFDTNVFIYATEGTGRRKQSLGNFFSLIEEKNGVIVTSELTLAECLVKPKKDRNDELKPPI